MNNKDVKRVTVKFVTGYRGVLTHETYYQAGEVVEVSANVAAQMVEDGRAELVVKPAPKPKRAPRKRKPKASS